MKNNYISYLAAFVMSCSLLTGCASDTVTPEADPAAAEAASETTEAASETTEAEDTAKSEPEEITEAAENGAEEKDEAATEGEPVSEEYDLYDTDNLVAAAATKATVETDIRACMADIRNEENPYDVSWDYGEEWELYVDACDWSLVFDAEYYKATFPMLAKQYHNDDDLLLRHFQTVGVHEGRQASADFNVVAYFRNCSDDVYYALGKSSYSSYYIYYMMHYDEEKAVNTVTSNSGKPVSVLPNPHYTALQNYELKAINAYRAEGNVEPLTMTPEMCAFANYRAYIQREEGYVENQGHDWARANGPIIEALCDTVLGRRFEHFGENTVTSQYNLGTLYAEKYHNSEEHNDALMSAKYHVMGVSNAYKGHKGYTSQYDLFLD